MTLFTRYHHTCPVTECPHNKGERGLSCGFANDPVLICMHPDYKRLWREATGFGTEWIETPAQEQDRRGQQGQEPRQEVLL